MKIVFTICSNNYLAQAKALGDSLLTFNPDYQFIICLVDHLSNDIDYGFFKPYKILTIEEIGITGFDQMFARYDITELNTSVKPFIFNYLFLKYDSYTAIIYLDPDILVYDRFTELENSLNQYNIVLTPHFFTPIYDDFKLSEPDILNAGLYNLGFIAVSRSDESDRFINWWMIKLRDQCYIDFKNGLFVDQLWINFVPIYFEKVLILRHAGYNVAYWNFHERYVMTVGKNYVINNDSPLVFFHFSGYNFKEPGVVSKYQTRYHFSQRKDVLPLFEDYLVRVMNNQYENFFSIPCYYVQLKQMEASKNIPETKNNSIKNNLTAFIKVTFKRILFRQQFF